MLLRDWLQLEILHLMENQISDILTDAFKGLTAFKELYLYGNQLSEIKQGAFINGLPGLLYLSLSDNQLSKIPAGTFYELPKFTRIVFI